MENKKEKEKRYYDSEEYAKKIAETNQKAQQIIEEKAKEAEKKKREINKEKKKLRSIFTEERCGKENAHFVSALIDRAAFLRVEIEHIEEDLRREGMMDFFVQGTQTLWREHPLSKMHVQHSKSYRETIKQLETYGKLDTSDDGKSVNPIVDVIQRGNQAREKYQKNH